jgi:hypothetical protein
MLEFFEDISALAHGQSMNSSYKHTLNHEKRVLRAFATSRVSTMVGIYQK